MLKSKLLKFFSISFSCLTLLCATGCQKAPAAPSIPVYKAAELPEGIFIKKGKRDNTFEGIYVPSQATSSSFQWTATEDHLIPHIEPGDELVLHTTQEIPKTLTLYSMKDFGYTAGMRFTYDDENECFTISGDDSMWCPDSILYSFWAQQLGTFDNVKLIDIEGNEFTKKNISQNGFLKGLDKDSTYNINLYKGTEFKTIKTIADSHAFIRDKEYVLRNYVEMKDVFFVITLPKNMESGYWIIDGFGMFFLEKDVELTGSDLEEITEDINLEDNPEISEALLDDSIPAESIIEEPKDDIDLGVEESTEPQSEEPTEQTEEASQEQPQETVEENPQG